jgi:hypothetical protein
VSFLYECHKSHLTILKRELRSTDWGNYALKDISSIVVSTNRVVLAAFWQLTPAVELYEPQPFFEFGASQSQLGTPHTILGWDGTM